MLQKLRYAPTEYAIWVICRLYLPSYPSVNFDSIKNIDKFVSITKSESEVKLSRVNVASGFYCLYSFFRPSSRLSFSMAVAAFVMPVEISFY